MTEFEQLIGVQFAKECFELVDDVVFWRERPRHHFSTESAHATFLKKYAGKPAGRKGRDSGRISMHRRKVALGKAEPMTIAAILASPGPL